MNAKRDFYKNHVDRRVRIRKLIYLTLFLITFCIVLHDAFVNDLPFHFILFFLIGRMMILVLAKTQKVRQRETDNKFTIERNCTGIVIIVAVIISRIFIFPRILTEMNVVFISDAVLLIGMGWFLGRIKLISAKIEGKAFPVLGPPTLLGRSKKMTGKTIMTALLMIVSFFYIASSFAQDSNGLMLVTNEFPPYASLKDGQFSGIAVDIVTKLMNQAGYSGKIIMLPWRRALQYSQTQKMMLFPYTRRPYREKSFKWIGPIMNDRFVFAVRRSDKRIFSNIDDFKNLQIGVSESTPTAFRLHELGFGKLQIVTSEKFNAKKLVAGNRIDAWYAPYLILKYTLQFEKIAEEEIRIAFLDIDVDMYIGASLSVPDETVALWQKNLDEMKADGTYQLIISKH